MQRKYILIVIITILVALLTVGGSILASYVSSLVSPAFKPLALPLLSIIAVAVAALTVWLYFLQRGTDHAIPTPGSQNRQRILVRVHTFWIKDVLEQSLHGAALIALGLHEQPDALVNPWQLEFQQPDQLAHPLPLGTRITQVYDDVGGELLILGEPGSGKTTLLLELARDLLDRARKNEAHLMPVVFILSSWTKQQPLSDWLVEELSTKYQVPHKLGRSWVDGDQLLLLLDGLDEVAREYRGACIDAINTYRKEHMVPMVICCRSKDYFSQGKRVQLDCAVIVQPLTTQQIDTYLSSTGEQLVSVRTALHNDLVLQELVTTPLMLSILTLAYQGKSVEDISAGVSLEAQRSQIFETYTQRMLQRRGTKSGYTAQQTRSWLGWLARQLARLNQTEFYIEHMQPDWLSEGRLYQVYRNIVTRLIDGLIFGLVGGMAYKLLFELVGARLTVVVFSGFLCVLIGKLDSEKRPVEVVLWSWMSMQRNLVDRLRFGLIVGLVIGLAVGTAVGLILGLVTGLIVGLVSGLIGGLVSMVVNCLGSKLDMEKRPVKVVLRSRASKQRDLIDGLLFGLIVGLIVGLIGGPSIGLAFGLSGGVVYGLVNMLDPELGKEIEYREIFHWSWSGMRQNLVRNLRNGLIIGLVGGVIIMLVVGLVVGLTRGLIFGLAVGMTIGLDAGLVRWLRGGWSSEVMDKSNLVKPNQGIWRSARNSVLVGLIAGVAIGSVFGVIVGLILGLNNGLISALVAGVVFGVVVGFQHGGRAYVEHFVLRLFLWYAGHMPLNYPHFLDYATERILLRKVGGGYIFIHRLLREYFETVDTRGTLDGGSDK
jgi:hypothetical protein